MLNNIDPHPAYRLLLDAFSLQNTRSLLCCLVIDLVPFLSYCFSTVQVWWLCVHARQCTMQCTSSQGNSGCSSKHCSWFCSGKDVWQHCSSHKTGWGPIQHIFSWTLVKATDNFVVFFAFWRVTLLCLVFLLKEEISMWISVYHINECSITENLYLVWFISG